MHNTEPSDLQQYLFVYCMCMFMWGGEAHVFSVMHVEVSDPAAGVGSLLALCEHQRQLGRPGQPLPAKLPRHPKLAILRGGLARS